MRKLKRKIGVEAVLLDLDGTVVDSRAAYLEAARLAFSTFGHKTFDISVVLEIPKRLEQGKAIDDLVEGIDFDAFLDFYLKSFYAVTRFKSKLIPKVEESLMKLFGRFRLALVTLRCVPQEIVVDELSALGLIRYFDIVMTAFERCQPKPSPEAFVKCALKLGIRTDRCVVVGDSVVDIRAGKSAGMRAVAVLSGLYSCSELQAERPELILENITLLPDFIDLLVR